MSLSVGHSNKSSLGAYATRLSAEAVGLSRESYKSVARVEASQQGFNINNVDFREGEDHSCKPAHLLVTNTVDAETKSELLTALDQIKFMQLDFKVSA